MILRQEAPMFDKDLVLRLELAARISKLENAIGEESVWAGRRYGLKHDIKELKDSVSDIEDDVCKRVGIDSVKTRLKELEELVGSLDYDCESIKRKVRGIETRLLRNLEWLVGKSESDYGILLWDVRELKNDHR